MASTDLVKIQAFIGPKPSRHFRGDFTTAPLPKMSGAQYGKNGQELARIDNYISGTVIWVVKEAIIGNSERYLITFPKISTRAFSVISSTTSYGP